MPAWSGLQSVVAVNIADAIAAALLAHLAERRKTPRVALTAVAAPANS